MSDYVFYSSNYLTHQVACNNPHAKKENSHFCNAACLHECSKKTTHLLFSDSLKNLFRQLKSSFKSIADSDLYSLYLYTAYTLWPFDAATGNAFTTDVVHLVGANGQETKIKGKATKYRRKLAQIIKTLEEELYEEEIVKDYLGKLTKLPAMEDLALLISEERSIGYIKAWKLAAVVAIYFEHDYLPPIKNNEERALNFYLRHKVADSHNVRLVYQQPEELRLNALAEQQGAITACDGLKRQQWHCELEPPL